MNREQIAARLDDAGWLYDHGMVATIETLIREAEAAARAEERESAVSILMDTDPVTHRHGGTDYEDARLTLYSAIEAIRARGETT